MRTPRGPGPFTRLLAGRGLPLGRAGAGAAELLRRLPERTEILAFERLELPRGDAPVTPRVLAELLDQEDAVFVGELEEGVLPRERVERFQLLERLGPP